MTDVCRDPVFILTASRSGSTLLRFILDTHPDLACPPETMITAACVCLLRSSDILANAGSGHHRPVNEPASPPTEALEVVRDTVDQIFNRYLARRGKSRWCDKSLDNLMNAGVLAELYPQARFICLYRHCMDVIASGAEVSPWGVSRFGFDPYVADHPGNTVAAIGSYWADCARSILAFEDAHRERCHRVRYEDLVTAPEEVAAGLLAFLGAAPMPGITMTCFQTPHEGDGPGDEKIWFTTRVSAEALGRGVKVPATALPQALRDQINESLARLGYRTVGGDWNDTAVPLDPRQLDTVAVATGPEHGPRAASGRGDAATRSPVVAAIERRIHSRSPAELDECVIRWPALAGRAVTLVVTGDGEISELTWMFPPGPEEQGQPGEPQDGPVATVIADPAVWQAILDGQANIITELRHGRLRCLNRRDAHRLRSDEVHAVGWLLIPQLLWYRARAPRDQPLAWDRFWASIQRTGADGEVLWDAASAGELENVRTHALAHMATGLPVVDVGCGNGRFSRLLAGSFPHVLGIDVSPHAVKRAEDESADAGNVEYRVLDATAAGAVPHRRSSIAAVSPATPPPTIATVVSSGVACVVMGRTYRHEMVTAANRANRNPGEARIHGLTR